MKVRISEKVHGILSKTAKRNGTTIDELAGRLVQADIDRQPVEITVKLSRDQYAYFEEASKRLSAEIGEVIQALACDRLQMNGNPELSAEDEIRIMLWEYAHARKAPHKVPSPFGRLEDTLARSLVDGSRLEAGGHFE